MAVTNAIGRTTLIIQNDTQALMEAGNVSIGQNVTGTGSVDGKTVSLLDCVFVV